MNGLAVWIIIAVFVVGGIISMMLSARSTGRKQRAELKERFGQIPDGDVEFDSVAVPWRSGVDKESGCFVDDTTWSDLDMDEVFSRIDSCETSLGEEYLYLLLRRFSDDEETERREKFMDSLDHSPELRLRLQFLLHKVGKSNYNGLAGFISNSEDYMLPHAWIYRVLTALPLVGVCLAPFQFVTGMVVIFGSLSVNILMSYFMPLICLHNQSTEEK